MRIWIALIAVLTLLGPRAAAADDAAAAFDKIVKLCEAGPEQAVACEKSVWNFADVTKDGKLTVAELSRLARFFGEAFDRKLAAGGTAGVAMPKDLNTLPAALIFGPLTAQLLIANFDYDADGSVSREELYADLAEGKFASFVEKITQSGKQAIGQAGGPLFSVLGKNAIGASTMTAQPSTPKMAAKPGASARAAVGGPATDLAVAPPVTMGAWSAKLVAAGPQPYFEIAYTLKNSAAAGIQWVDGIITFRDPQDTAFMAIKVARDKGLPAGGEARLTGNYPVDPNNAGHMKLRDMPKEWVRAELSVQRVVMADGAQINY